MVPVRSVEISEEIRPDTKKVKEMSQKYNTVGYYVFSL